MSNLVIEILLRLAKAGIAALLGVVLYLVLVGPLRRDRLGRARAAVLAQRRGLRPARRDGPDLTGVRCSAPSPIGPLGTCGAPGELPGV